MKNKVTNLEILSTQGGVCKIESKVKMTIYNKGKKVKIKSNADGTIEFNSVKNEVYTFKG